MMRFQVTIPGNIGYSSQAVETFLLDQLQAKVSSDAQVLLLAPDEAIGNLKDFMEAAHAAAKELKQKNDEANRAAAEELKQKNDEALERNSQHNYKCAVELSRALDFAIERLDILSMALENKKLKRFVRDLKNAYEEFGITI